MTKAVLSGLTLVAILLFIATQTGASASVLPVATSAPTPDTGGVDLTHLPLGDGRLATGPKVGWIWPCRTDPDGRGAFRDGPWIRHDGTYDLTAKAIVDGSVSWPNHHLEVSHVGDKRVITTNDLPDHGTGVFPIARSDDAYQYDRNPNRIAQQNFRVELPANPVLAARPLCVPGAVGILLTGSALFNALDAPGRDAVAHETQDSCQGHPQQSGDYHYHSLTSCLPNSATPDGHSTLVGYSLDGFGIFGRRGEGGKVLTSADLDECHGHSHEIEWDGRKVVMYHYHATWDFPYTIGCMRGTYKMSDVMVISGPPPGGGPGGPGGPPPPPR
jgi:YHYH protein